MKVDNRLAGDTISGVREKFAERSECDPVAVWLVAQPIVHGE